MIAEFPISGLRSADSKFIIPFSKSTSSMWWKPTDREKQAGQGPFEGCPYQ